MMDEVQNAPISKVGRQQIQKVKEIVNQTSLAQEEKLRQISELLEDNIESFDWVGFYLVDPEAERELVLGPFAGEPTEHTRIPFGHGICGQAAETEQTFVVQDVDQADNYLECSLEVEAEIVLPVMKDGAFVAELDIDSHTKNAITKEHQAMLQEICHIIAAVF